MKSACCFWSLLLILPIASTVSAQEPPSYAKQIGPFFLKYCVECHNDKKPRRGLSLESYKSLKEGGDHGDAIIPGKADESRLVQMLEGLKEPKMPPEEHKLHPKKEEIALVRAWVEAGAKFDAEVKKTVLPLIQAKIKLAPPVTALAYFPSGKFLVAGCYKDLLLCDTAKGEVVGKLGGWTQPVTALSLNKEGNRLAVAFGQSGMPSRIVVFPCDENSPLVWGMPVEITEAHGDVIHHLTFSPDGKSLLSAGYDRLVKIWDMPGGKLLQSLKEHSDSVYGITFRPDGKLFATTAADRTVKVWQAGTGKLLYTLGEATDWMYTVAWSPDGKHLAAGGVDKSIRVWEAGETEAKIAQSVFAHQAAVWQLVYSADGKTLFSLGEDKIVKAWDAHKMTELHVFPAQPEAALALAVNPKGKQLALGRFDGAMLLLDDTTGAAQSQPLPTKQQDIPAIKAVVQEIEPNNSPGTGQKITLPATIVGAIDKAGDVDFFRFQAKAGQQFGAQVVPDKAKGKPAFEAFLELTDAKGKVLIQSNDSFLGYTFAKDGWYAIGVRDRDFGGNPGMKYELRVGDVPVVTTVYPLGLQQGTEADIHIEGVNIGVLQPVTAKADAKAVAGSKMPISLAGMKPMPLGLKQLVVGEFPEILKQPGKVPTVPVPGTANGVIATPGEMDTWKFQAKKGQKLILEINARRLGSELDSFIEILDAKGEPVPVATLRAQAKTFVTFRDHNSVSSGIRIDAWSELAINDYIYVGTELLKIKNLPPNPDADCSFYSEKGKRLGFLGTTPTHLTKGEPMYKVSIHPPGTKFSPNGFPVVTLFYRNDDGGADYGRDSRLFFDPPEDGEYQVRVGDSTGQGGINYGYRLTIRPPQPSFNVRFNPTGPSISKGGAIPITVSADRFDGYEGPIQVWFENLPPGFSAPTSAILHNEENTTFALWADASAKTPAKGQPLKLIAEATINGKKIRKEILGGMVQAVDPGDLVTTTEQAEVTLKPGGHAKLTLHIERRNGFAGRVPITVQGLPHGVLVLDIGLNGILINEKETKRTIEFYCEPWVQALEHPIVISAQREGKGTQHAAKSVLLKVTTGK